jgi:hypothetical protein
MLRCMSTHVLRVSDDGRSRWERRAPGAVVRKPPRNEPAGDGARKVPRGYGDLSDEEGACDGSQWARGRAMRRLVAGRGRC